MPKLNQILAIEKGDRQQASTNLTALHRKAEKPDLFEGRTRTYKPVSEDGEKLPDEVQLVQMRARDVLAQVAEILTPAWNIVATKDYANANEAKADVVLDNGVVLIEKAPVSFLLWMEKELTDLQTFVKKMPTLDPSEKWEFVPDQNVFKTNMSWTNRLKPELKVLVKAPPTEEHPAQTETYTENVVIGRFEAMRMSGAFQSETKEKVLDKISAVKKAVLFARESANSIDVGEDQVCKRVGLTPLGGSNPPLETSPQGPSTRGGETGNRARLHEVKFKLFSQA